MQCASPSRHGEAFWNDFGNLTGNVTSRLLVVSHFWREGQHPDPEHQMVDPLQHLRKHVRVVKCEACDCVVWPRRSFCLKWWRFTANDSLPKSPVRTLQFFLTGAASISSREQQMKKPRTIGASGTCVRGTRRPVPQSGLCQAHVSHWCLVGHMGMQSLHNPFETLPGGGGRVVGNNPGMCIYAYIYTHIYIYAYTVGFRFHGE